MNFGTTIFKSFEDVPCELRNKTLAELMLYGATLKAQAQVQAPLPSVREVCAMPLEEMLLQSDFVCRVAPYTIPGFVAAQAESVRKRSPITLDKCPNGTSVGNLVLLSQIAPDPADRQVFADALNELQKENQENQASYCVVM